MVRRADIVPGISFIRKTQSMKKKIFYPTSDPNVGARAMARPTRKPDEDDPVVEWFEQTSSRAYKPYLVRVKSRDDTTQMLTFVFLNNMTGQDLGGDPYEVCLSNPAHVYAEAPSSAQACESTDPDHNCGFLFLTHEYIESPEVRDNAKAAGVDLLRDAAGDSKWPRSAGDETALTSKLFISGLQNAIGGKQLSDLERQAIQTALNALPFMLVS